MKKILFASAFALMGTFALANNTDTKFEFLKYFQCTGVTSNCGMALIYCWQGELDPDRLQEFRNNACNDKEESEPEDEVGS